MMLTTEIREGQEVGAGGLPEVESGMTGADAVAQRTGGLGPGLGRRPFVSSVHIVADVT